MTAIRPTSIAIHALGGQGGGVLADWIVETAERAGYQAQYTFIAGVAQRTGATVYYIEIFPNHETLKAEQQPVMALMPVAGDVDIVIASELMEAGRSISRGFVTPDKTTLIASSHRVYAIGEKMDMGDGRKPDEPVLKAAKASSKQFVHFDMEALAKENGTIISAVMFGALAGSGALPFNRAAYEDVIRHAGRAVETNLAGFAAGFDSSQDGLEFDESPPQDQQAGQPSRSVQPLLDKLSVHFPVDVHEVVLEGLKRLVDYQDVKYAELYIERLRKIKNLDKKLGAASKGWQLTRETARYLALAMSFEDTIRVADLKTRASRFDRVRDDVKAGSGQIIETTEFLHPRIDEICDMLPNSLGRMIMTKAGLKNFMGRFFKKGRFVKTNKLGGFLLLYLVASIRPFRKMSYRYAVENERIESWLAHIDQAASQNYDFGCAVASCQRLIKGYGETHQRGLGSFNRILAAYDKIASNTAAAETMRRLVDAALEDEDGTALDSALASI